MKRKRRLADLAPLREELEMLPAHPISRVHPKNWVFRIKRMADAIGHARPANAAFFRTINPYPTPFEHHKVETDDGVGIALWYGPPGGEAGAKNGSADKPAFGLVIVPGMFSTKDDSVHKKRAIWMWRHWKIPVVCIDMRAFGESNGIATGGWKEAYDVTAAAKFLKETAGVDKVAVLAESMGGASALNAMALDEESGDRLLTAGTLCYSCFVDLKDAVHYISSEPPKTDPFHIQWEAFRRLLRYKSHGGYERFDEYLDDAAQVNGLSGFDEMADLGNPKWKTALIKGPTLLVHAADDPVVPVRHARRMERYARRDAHIQVVTVPWGQHTGFESMDPIWFWKVTTRFFSYVNGVELPNPWEAQRRRDPKA